MNIFDFVPDIFKKEQYATCYSSSIYPANGQSLWQRTEYTDLQPPPIKKQLGRPKKRRNKDANEMLDKSQLKRAKWGIRCSRCNQSGHNKSTCKLPPPPPPPTSHHIQNPTSAQGKTNQPPPPAPAPTPGGSSQQQNPTSQQQNPTGAASARTSAQQKRTSKRKGKEKVSSTQPGANIKKKKVSARANGSTSSQH